VSPIGNDVVSRLIQGRYRYVSSAVALFFIVLTGTSVIWAYNKLPRVMRKAVLMILAVCTLMVSIKVLVTRWVIHHSFQSTIAIYRLSVMYNWTDSLLSAGPNTLNSPRAKAAFYVLHALPEWLASFVLFCTNVRQVFGTGLFGDWRHGDETAKQRAKREERERKAAERRKK
jgi:hypothetical protein